MVNKDNIQEQILKDMLLKMNYDSSKTLSENIQEINIQSYYLINEQTDSKWKDRISKGIWSLQVGSERYEKEKGYEGAVEFIKQVQKQLGLPDTGVFDKTMKNKVVEFQKSVGEKPDGIIGKNTYGKLPKMGDSTKKSKSSDKGSTVFDIPDRTMQSDNTRIDPQYLGLMPDGKPIPPGLRLNYAGKNKPSPPSHQDIVYSSNISSYDRKMMMSKLDYFVTYTSPRLKKLIKDNKICSTYVVGVGGASCKGIKGKGLLMKAYKSDLEDWEERQPSAMAEFIHEYRHGIIDALAIATFFIPFVGPVISLGLEAGNAALYYREGDNYSAGLSAAFALIPFGGVLRRIPGVKEFGRGFLVTSLKKARTLEQGRKLAKPMTKLEKEAVEAFSKKSDEIMKAAQAGAKKEGIEVGVKTTSKTISKTLKNKISKLIKDDFSEVVYKVYKYAKKHPIKFSLATTGLQIGTVWYSWDKLADIYGITDKDKSTNTQSSATEEKVVTITDYDKTWDYKKDGDKYYTKKKDSDKWTLTSGTSKEAIKTKIFGSGSKYGKTILTPEQKEIESFVKNNHEYIVKSLDVDTVGAESILNDIFSDL